MHEVLPMQDLDSLNLHYHHFTIWSANMIVVFMLNFLPQISYRSSREGPIKSMISMLLRFYVPCQCSCENPMQFSNCFRILAS